MATPFDKGKINQQDIQETIDSSKLIEIFMVFLKTRTKYVSACLPAYLFRMSATDFIILWFVHVQTSSDHKKTSAPVHYCILNI